MTTINPQDSVTHLQLAEYRGRNAIAAMGQKTWSLHLHTDGPLHNLWREMVSALAGPNDLVDLLEARNQNPDLPDTDWYGTPHGGPNQRLEVYLSRNPSDTELNRLIDRASRFASQNGCHVRKVVLRNTWTVSNTWEAPLREVTI